MHSEPLDHRRALGAVAYARRFPPSLLFGVRVCPEEVKVLRVAPVLVHVGTQRQVDVVAFEPRPPQDSGDTRLVDKCFHKVEPPAVHVGVKGKDVSIKEDPQCCAVF